MVLGWSIIYNHLKMKKKVLLGLIIVLSFFQMNAQKNDTILYRFCNDNYECGYLSTSGDTIIPIGKYGICYTDSIKKMGIVLKDSIGFIAIDAHDNMLFEVFSYDNGPDFPSEGLFRIINNEGLIGYATTEGQIVIAPQYKCAYPFVENKAKVSCDCKIISEGEHQIWYSDNWFYILKDGSVYDAGGRQ